MANRGLTLLGFPNVVQHPATILASFGSAPVDMPASLHKTDEPTDVARILTVDPLSSIWTASFTFGTVISGMATVNSNLSMGGFYRYRESNGLDGFASL